jgi:hypothetical protein
MGSQAVETAKTDQRAVRVLCPRVSAVNLYEIRGGAGNWNAVELSNWGIEKSLNP